MKEIKLIIPAIILVLLGTGCGSQKNTETKENGVKIFAVKTQIIKADTFVHFFQATGNAFAIESAFISPQANGQLIKLNVRDGDRVTQGQLLAKLNASVLKSSISELETQLALAQTTFQKQKALWDKKIGSEIQFLQSKTQKEALEKKLQTLNNQLALTEITAPFAGIVENIQINEGELASPGRQLFELINLSQMKILADVSESYLPKIKKGDQVKITFPDYPDKVIFAPIFRTGNVINPSNRTFKVEVQFPNPKEKIKPNMLAQITAKDFESDTAFIVPSIIIKKDFEKEFLFIAKQKGNQWIAEKRFIKTGISYKDKTMVTSGLKVGEIIIIDGYNQIATNSELKLVK